MLRLVGAALAFLQRDLAWMWIGLSVGLLARALWPYRTASEGRESGKSPLVEISARRT
ncbi:MULTISPECIES: hypothetical protein [unclassified Rhodococcus (in: high G+C Gram-positive bacteria)]|uniref:hypothetical protein n=1 Tax=unclassified Rhodococcus (in: high G+C Gram-positive bacteria) TaxID=192944 RepID=UPI000A907CB1|nr:MULTISPECIES: hypothetical protein [unclassified Rhodococcus (in: high G+C Gram-positive bacteria)]